ncbi:phytanoyl-CoA dioxygenase family protein [Stieleria sp. JC731]|uniref:phytanoyl-CoA dioxygenase family protein n=1 Tax=Pirellulaceae TaxID=2691357 RepID=UPI001E59A04A|nr:phytanoyl-CoA dioxygenase family protein [Stieleria sp. JC731]MCC9601419.1 phytanoyl-CoA dioxygenase family protein [Stieleria sp. JC731]
MSVPSIVPSPIDSCIDQDVKTIVMKDYQIIPTEDELQALQRDLSFHPSTTTSPSVLTEEQIQQFNTEGYIRPLEIFTAEEITGIRNYFDNLLEQVVAGGGNSYSISSAHLKYGPVYDLLTDERIVSRVADLLGENVIGWGSHFFCKMPGDGKAVAWHQDASYWPLSPSKAVTVWLAIDDADLENGCMKFIAGSHTKGHMTYRPSDSGEHNVLNQTIEDPHQYGTEVIDPLKAGQASIHADLLLHGSEANNSDRRRCGLTLRYCSADVHADMGWNEKGVHVRGTDPTGHWSNRERPNG